MTWEIATLLSVIVVCVSVVGVVWLKLQTVKSEKTESMKLLESEVAKLKPLESRLTQLELNMRQRGVFG